MGTNEWQVHVKPSAQQLGRYCTMHWACLASPAYCLSSRPCQHWGLHLCPLQRIFILYVNHCAWKLTPVNKPCGLCPLNCVLFHVEVIFCPWDSGCSVVSCFTGSQICRVAHCGSEFPSADPDLDCPPVPTDRQELSWRGALISLALCVPRGLVAASGPSLHTSTLLMQ